MEKLSKKQEKQLRSLKQKKFRDIHQQFIVEGEKMVKAALNSKMKVSQLITVDENKIFPSTEEKWVLCDEISMGRISNMKTPPGVMAVVQFNEPSPLKEEGIILVLDRIQDPGNLGTIIRTAEGMGVSKIYCSSDSVDVYNPKVVQASMGSIFNLSVEYIELKQLLKTTNLAVYGALLEGKNLYQTEMKSPAIVLLGNESNGIEADLKQYINTPIHIPMKGKLESFNLAISTAVILAQFQACAHRQ